MYNKSSITESFKSTLIIYFSLIIVQVLFLIVAIVFVNNSENIPNKELDNVFIIVVPVFGITMMYISRILYYKNVAKIDRSISLGNKLNSYRTSKIISWALIESGCMLSLVAYMLTFNLLYVIVFLFLIGFFLMIRPSKENFVKDFNLTPEEQMLF